VDMGISLDGLLWRGAIAALQVAGPIL